jgi:hypothetical protein
MNQDLDQNLCDLSHSLWEQGIQSFVVTGFDAHIKILNDNPMYPVGDYSVIQDFVNQRLILELRNG